MFFEVNYCWINCIHEGKHYRKKSYPDLILCCDICGMEFEHVL